MNKYQEALYVITSKDDEIERNINNYIKKYNEHPTKTLINLINRNAKLEKAIKMLKEHFEFYYNICVDDYVLKACLPLEIHLFDENYKILNEVLYE